MAKLSRVFLLLAILCMVITMIALIPTGQSEWGGAFWLGAHLFLLLAFICILIEVIS